MKLSETGIKVLQDAAKIIAAIKNDYIVNDVSEYANISEIDLVDEQAIQELTAECDSLRAYLTTFYLYKRKDTDHES